jgi:hypothetical protein
MWTMAIPKQAVAQNRQPLPHMGPYFSSALTLVLYITLFVCTEMITLASGVLTNNLTPVLAPKESHEEYGRVS